MVVVEIKSDSASRHARPLKGSSAGRIAPASLWRRMARREFDRLSRNFGRGRIFGGLQQRSPRYTSPVRWAPKGCHATWRTRFFLEVAELTGKARPASWDGPAHVPLSQNVHIQVVQFGGCQGLRHQRGSWPVVRGNPQKWVLYQPCVVVPTPGVFTCSVFVCSARQFCLRRSP